MRFIASLFWAFSTVAAVASTQGCTAPVGEESDDLTTVKVDFTVLEGPRRSAAKAGLTVITSTAEYQKFFGEAPPSSVSFNKHWVLHYSVGIKNTGGYGTEVTRITRTGSGNAKKLVVSTWDTSPGPHCIVTQALTNPQITVRIAKQQPSVTAKVEPYKDVNTCTLAAPLVDECVRGARECAFNAISKQPSVAGDATKARALFDGCLAKVKLDDPDAEGGTCDSACQWEGQALCDGVVALLPSYAKQGAACVKVVNECVDYCHGEGDNWNDGIQGDYVKDMPEFQCLLDAKHDNCDKYARKHKSCGGTIAAGGNAECLAQCHAAVAPWGAGDDDAVKEYCDGQCE
jgi:hypothetical protein